MWLLYVRASRCPRSIFVECCHNFILVFDEFAPRSPIRLLIVEPRLVDNGLVLVVRGRGGHLSEQADGPTAATGEEKPMPRDQDLVAWGRRCTPTSYFQATGFLETLLLEKKT